VRQLILSLGVLTAVLICREYAFATEGDDGAKTPWGKPAQGVRAAPLAEEPVPPADADPDHVEVEFGGLVVDHETGKPVERFGLQWGLPMTAEATEIGWGGITQSPRARKGGKFHEKLGSGRGRIFALRILADGYLPQPVTPQPVTTPAKNTNLVVRLKRGFEVRGRIVDHTGKPVSKAIVCLGGNQVVDVVDGELGHFAGSKTLTDDDGRFVLQGVDKAKKHNLVVSANSPHIWRADMPELGKEAKIALPEPATLKIRYQIPGTRDKARFRLHMKTWEIERWKGVVESVQEIEIPNGGEVVLNNLAPGTYDLARVKTIYVGGFGQGAFCGRRDVTLEPGQSVEAGCVRSVGHPITGQVVGLGGAGVNGAFLFVREAEVTGNPLNRDEWKMVTFDAQAVDVEGHFKTEHVAPGTYTLVVYAYKPEDRSGPRHSGERLPDLIGSAKVTVEADRRPEPVRIEMKPRPTPTDTLSEKAAAGETAVAGCRNMPAEESAQARDHLLGWYTLADRTLIPVFKVGHTYYSVVHPGIEVPLKEAPGGLEWALTPSSMVGTKIGSNEKSNEVYISIVDAIREHHEESFVSGEKQPMTRVGKPSWLLDATVSPPHTHDDFLGWYQPVWSLHCRLEVRKEGKRYLTETQILRERGKAGSWVPHGGPHVLSMLPGRLGFVMKQKDRVEYHILYNESARRFELTPPKADATLSRIPLARIAPPSSEKESVPSPRMRIGIPSWH
jgi:hypothetical protein